MKPISLKDTGLRSRPCSYCGRTIAFAQGVGGTTMPLDADTLLIAEWDVDLPADHPVAVIPDKDPSKMLHRADRCATLRHWRGLILATPHFATCPHASQARQDARERREARRGGEA